MGVAKSYYFQRPCIKKRVEKRQGFYLMSLKRVIRGGIKIEEGMKKSRMQKRLNPVSRSTEKRSRLLQRHRAERPGGPSR